MLIDVVTQRALEEMGLGPKIQTLDKYMAMLVDANKTLNLVGRQQSLERISQLHLLDSLLPWPLFKSVTPIVDVGTGGGFPGICWAIVCEDEEFLLIEKSPKKCQFLTYVIQQLKLERRVRVINARVEDCVFPAALIVSRAVTQAASFLEMTKNLSHDEDLAWWLLKARQESIQQELESLDDNLWSWEVLPLKHPVQDVSRHLVQIKKRRL
jgi:16S rRNA (guanine527-N7)-methyltransferase